MSTIKSDERPGTPVAAYAVSVLGVPLGLYAVISYATVAMGLFALVDAAFRRSDAFPAADRQTKPVWLAILGAGLVCQVIFGPLFSLLGLAGVVAAIVYLVDVRRRVIEVTRGPRW